MKADDLLVLSKEQKDKEAREVETIAEIVRRLNFSIDEELTALLKAMAKRQEPPRNVLMGITAFGALLVAEGITTSGSDRQEDFADEVCDKFREWLFEAIGAARAGEGRTKH